jgi:hypothetical protein
MIRCGLGGDVLWQRAGISPWKGRRLWLPAGTVAEVRRVTFEESPDDSSAHWTTRRLEERLGIGKESVARVWWDQNRKPCEASRFKNLQLPRV